MLINILTRTSNRPKGFERCYNSIQNQTYKNVRHLVSYDDDKDLEYLKDKNVELFKVDPKELLKQYKGKTFNKTPKFPHNLYINHLLEQVEDGWVLILDDDDYLYNENSLEELFEHIKSVNEDTILIFQMEYPNKKLLPGKLHFRIKKPGRGNIGSCCFLFHFSHKKKSKFPPIRCGDYEFINELYQKIKYSKWIHKPFTKVGSDGGLGKRRDI